MSRKLEGRTVASVLSDITNSSTQAVSAAANATTHNTRYNMTSTASSTTSTLAGSTVLASAIIHNNEGNVADKISQLDEIEARNNDNALNVSNNNTNNNTTTTTTMSSSQHKQVDVSSQTQSILISMLAGAMAGAIAKTTIAPLDRTKINFQATNKRFSTKEALRFLSSSYKNEGLLSLWRGNSATMARIIPYAGIQYTAHDQFKRVLNMDEKRESIWLRFLAGSLAGVTSQSLTYPLDMARARMAVTPRNTYSSLRQVFVKIWTQEGPLTLYRGFTPTMIGIIPYAGTSFCTYETLKQYHKSYFNSGEPNPLERAMCGAVAGLLGQTAAYPLDIVRRRMQTATVTGNGDCYDTIRSTILKVYREEGIIHGLFKGLSLNFLKGPLAVGISFATYDTLKLFLNDNINSR